MDPTSGCRIHIVIRILHPDYNMDPRILHPDVGSILQSGCRIRIVIWMQDPDLIINFGGDVQFLTDLLSSYKLYSLHTNSMIHIVHLLKWQR